VSKKEVYVMGGQIAKKRNLGRGDTEKGRNRGVSLSQGIARERCVLPINWRRKRSVQPIQSSEGIEKFLLVKIFF